MSSVQGQLAGQCKLRMCVITRVIPRWYRQFFRYRYFAGIRFVGFSVFRSVSIPPFFVYFPPLLPPFFQKGVELLKKGAIAPLLRKKGGTAPFFIPKCTDRVFLRYRYGKYREIPTEYRPKIPNRYTTLVITILSTNHRHRFTRTVGNIFFRRCLL